MAPAPVPWSNVGVSTSPASSILRTPEHFLQAVTARLDDLFAERRIALAELGPETQELADQLRDFTVGGKLLRPRLCYWGARAVLDAPGTDVEQALVDAGAALELLQSAALLHDDVIDDSPARRGRPAAHVARASWHVEQQLVGDAVRFGASTAILLGDLALSWSDDLLFPHAAPGSAVFDQFRAVRTEIVAGQYLDLLHQAGGLQGDPAQGALRVMRWKTVPYTVLRPLCLGAALAGGSAAEFAALEAIAVPLGTTFQLRDDQLGVFGDEAATGKPASGDLTEGKRTVLLAQTRATATEAERGVLDRSVGNPVASDNDLEEVRNVMITTGARNDLEAQIEEWADRSRDAIAAAGLPAAATEALAVLVDTMSRRER